MAEEFKVGGVIFDVGFEQSQIDEAFDNITREMKENAEQASEIYKREMTRIVTSFKLLEDEYKKLGKNQKNPLLEGLNKELPSLMRKLKDFAETTDLSIDVSLDTTDLYVQLQGIEKKISENLGQKQDIKYPFEEKGKNITKKAIKEIEELDKIGTELYKKRAEIASKYTNSFYSDFVDTGDMSKGLVKGIVEGIKKSTKTLSFDEVFKPMSDKITESIAGLDIAKAREVFRGAMKELTDDSESIYRHMITEILKVMESEDFSKLSREMQENFREFKESTEYYATMWDLDTSSITEEIQKELEKTAKGVNTQKAKKELKDKIQEVVTKTGKDIKPAKVEVPPVEVVVAKPKEVEQPKDTVVKKVKKEAEESTKAVEDLGDTIEKAFKGKLGNSEAQMRKTLGKIRAEIVGLDKQITALGREDEDSIMYMANDKYAMPVAELKADLKKMDEALKDFNKETMTDKDLLEKQILVKTRESTSLKLQLKEAEKKTELESLARTKKILEATKEEALALAELVKIERKLKGRPDSKKFKEEQFEAIDNYNEKRSATKGLKGDELVAKRSMEQQKEVINADLATYKKNVSEIKGQIKVIEDAEKQSVKDIAGAKKKSEEDETQRLKAIRETELASIKAATEAKKKADAEAKQKKQDKADSDRKMGVNQDGVAQRNKEEKQIQERWEKNLAAKEKAQEHFNYQTNETKKKELALEERISDAISKRNKNKSEADSEKYRIDKEQESINKRVSKLPTAESVRGNPEADLRRESELELLKLEQKKLDNDKQRMKTNKDLADLELVHNKKVVELTQEELALEKQIANLELAISDEPSDNKKGVLRDELRTLEAKQEQLEVSQTEAQVAHKKARNLVTNSEQELKNAEARLAIDKRISVERDKQFKQKVKEIAEEEKRVVLAGDKHGIERIKNKKTELEIEQRISTLQSSKDIKELEAQRKSLEQASKLEDIARKRQALSDNFLTTPPKVAESKKKGFDVEEKQIALERELGVIQENNSRLEFANTQRLINLDEKKHKLSKEIADLQLKVALDPNDKKSAQRVKDLQSRRNLLDLVAQRAKDELKTEQATLQVEEQQLKTRQQSLKVELDRINAETRENERASKAAKKTQSSNSEADKDANKQKKQMQDVSRGMNEMNMFLRGMMMHLGGRKLYEWLLGTPAEFQRTVNQFGILIDDLSRASETVEKLKAIAFSSPYNLIDMTTMANQLAGTDLYISSIEDLAPRLATLARGNAKILTQLTKATTDVVNAGTLQGQEIIQLKNTGIPVIKEIAHNLGVTNSEFKKMQQNGQITSEMYLDALRSMTDSGGQYYGLLESMSTDYLGRLEQVKGKMIEFGIEIGEEGMGKLTEYFEKLLEQMDSKEFQEVADRWSDAFSRLVDALIAVTDFIAKNPALAEWILALSAGALVIGTFVIAAKTLIFALAPLVTMLKTLGLSMGAATVTATGASTAIAGVGAAAAVSMPYLAALALAMAYTYKSFKDATLSIGEATGMYYDWNKELGKKEDAERAMGTMEDLRKEARELGISIDELKEKYYDMYKVHEGAMFYGGFEDASELLKKMGVDMNNLQGSSELLFDNIPEKIARLEELSSKIHLTADEELELLDILNNTLGAITPPTDFQGLFVDDKLVKAEMDKYLATVMEDIKTKTDVELVVAFNPEMAPVAEFVENYGDQITKLGQLSKEGELSLKDLQSVFGKGFDRGFYKNLEDYFEQKNMKLTAENMVNEFGVIGDAVGAMGDKMVEAYEQGSEGATAMAETVAESRRQIQAEIDMLSLDIKTSPTDIIKLDTTALKSELDYVSGLVTKVNDNPIKLFDDSFIDNIVTDAQVAGTAWNNFEKQTKGVFLTIAQGVEGQAMDLQTMHANKKFLEESAYGLYNQRLEFLKKQGVVGDVERAKEREAYEKQLEAIETYFSKSEATITQYTKSVIYSAKERGMISGEVASTLMSNFSSSIDSEQDKLSKSMEEFYAEAEAQAKKTPETLANEAYTMLTRELAVGVKSIEQFRKQAQEVRNKHYTADELLYKEYTKRYEDAVESHNKALEQKEKERLDKLKESLDDRRDILERNIEESVYRRASSTSANPFVQDYEKAKKEQFKAYKDGVITYKEYQANMQDVGQTAYDSRMKQHDKYLKDQDRKNKWTYDQQIAYTKKMQAEITQMYKKGLISYLTYQEELERINDTLVDKRMSQIDKLMNNHMDSVQKGYNKAQKAVDDYYDNIRRKEQDDDRQERLDKLLKLETEYANAVTKTGKDRLKGIREEIEAINDEIEMQRLDDEQKTKTEALNDQFDNFQSKFSTTMETIGSIAIDTAANVDKGVNALIKSFGKLDDFQETYNPYTKKGGAGNQVNNTTITNTIVTQNTSQAVAAGKQINDFTAHKQMGVASKKK